MMAKKHFVLLMIILILLSTTLSSCKKSDYIETNTSSETNIESSMEFPFLTPDFKNYKSQDGYYTYNNVTQEELSVYVNDLVLDGFNMQKSEYRYHLQKDNIFINIVNNTKSYEYFVLNYIQGISETRKDTLNCSEAKKIIGKDAIDIIEIYVPDLYEKTGSQLFYAYSKKPYSENSYSSFSKIKYIVKNNQAYELGDDMHDEYIVCDIDMDGRYELLYFTHGFTSGLFSFGLNALGFDNEINLKYCNYFTTEFINLKFNKLSDTDVYIYSGEYNNNEITPSEMKYRISIFDGKLILTDKDNNVNDGVDLNSLYSSSKTS